jgi:hypothetical protein
MKNFKFLGYLVFILIDLTACFAQSLPIKFEYKLKVSFIPEITNYRNVELHIKEHYSFYEVDYSRASN